jgi:hypothetical protein
MRGSPPLRGKVSFLPFFLTPTGTKGGLFAPIYLRFMIQPITAPAVRPNANVVATVSARCRWRR